MPAPARRQPTPGTSRPSPSGRTGSVIAPDTHGVGFTIHGVPPGQGRAPVLGILDQLEDCAPDRSVILEHWLPMGGDATKARAEETPWLDQTVAAAKTFLAGR